MAKRPEKQLGRLCEAVTASLLPFLEATPTPLPLQQLTREVERRLLLALSQVSKAIRGWVEEEELGCGLDQEIVACSGEIHNCCFQPDQAFDDGFSCLANIVSIVVGFLGFCSDYVKHSAGNILIALSSALIKFETVWTQFVELVWATVQASSTYAHCTSSSTSFAKSPIHGSSIMESLDHDISISNTSITSIIAVLNLHCIRMSGHMLAGLFRVLHAILKFLKHTDCELQENFICLSILHLQKMPWDFYFQLNAGQPISRIKDNKFDWNSDSAQLGILSGIILQLLCSLVEQSDLEDIDEQNRYAKLGYLVPKLLSFLKEPQDDPKGLPQYLKHKILMLMMRLKPDMQKNCSDIISWLKLLGQYFKDLLHEPISQHVELENCLEGSPFLSNSLVLVKIQDVTSRHLQRQATYLFLSCCLCLARNRNGSRLQCSCKRDAPLFDHELQGCSDHCNCIGLSEISEWFQRRCCLEKIVTSKSSTDFALSFLQLYMEEDDMLFSILLQLLDAPFVALEIESIKAKLTSALMGAKLFSTIFDPVRLFHLLLLLLHYDHLVLIDYLISKDTGVHCAQYLLKCLRLVSQSWHAFIDDSICEGDIERLHCKRQKISKDMNSSKGSLGPPSASLFTEDFKIGSSCGSSKNEQLFRNAKECLLSLKKTVEDLHRKELFPYNPKPLLRSLTRFEELCKQG